MRRVLALVVLASTSLAPVACSSKKPNPPMTPTTSPTDGGVLEAGAGPMVGADGGVVGSFGGTTDGGAPLATGDAGAPNLGNAAAAVVDATIDQEVSKIAAKSAPGMTIEGQPYRDTLQTNGHLNVIVTLQPNRCYTFIAYSPKDGVQQLDMQLLMAPLFNFPTNRAPSPKNESIMGKGKEPICPVSLVPLPYKVDVIASKGAGRVGLYVYTRAK